MECCAILAQVEVTDVVAAVMAANSPQDLRRARYIEAAYFNAARGYGDSEALRLDSLKSDLATFLAAHRKSAKFAELVLVPGEPARLWVDLLTSVVMEPNYRTYRIEQELDGKSTVILETTQREEALRFLQAYLSERASLPGQARPAVPMESGVSVPLSQWSTGFVIYAWLTGFVLGLLIILIAVNILK